MLSETGQRLDGRSDTVTLDVWRAALRPPQPWNAIWARDVFATPKTNLPSLFAPPASAQPEQSEILLMEAGRKLRYHAAEMAENSTHA